MKHCTRFWLALIGLALTVCAAPHVAAWNGTGHMTVANIAYDNLTPKTRAAVDTLLAKHRDYPLWMSEMPTGYTRIAVMSGNGS